MTPITLLQESPIVSSTHWANESVGRIAASDYRLARVLRQLQLDYCCGGKQSLTEAVAEKQLDLQTVLDRMQQAVNQTVAMPRFQDWGLDFLAQYIEHNHHRYVRSAIQDLQPLLDRMVVVHGENFPQYIEIKRLFADLSEELMSHMHKEEKILFPAIILLIQKGRSLDFAFGTLANPIRMMMHEHDEAGNILKEIHALTNDFHPPVGACGTVRLSYALLAEFEDDLMQHIHLENNILFPKALALEQSVQ